VTRPTDDLRAGSDWAAATDHRFVRELAAGTVEDAVFARYLVLDRTFVETLTGVFGRALAQAPPASRAPIAEFLGVLTDEEDDYFERALAALPDVEADPVHDPTTAAFCDHLLAAADEGGYAETLAVLVPAEWTYLDWATGVADPPEPFHLHEWVDLHANDAFAGFVDWLRAELDEELPTLSPRRRERVRDRFERTVRLERAFFDAAYGPTTG
jgi:thiaminase/transcriptional activator TenA